MIILTKVSDTNHYRHHKTKGPDHMYHHFVFPNFLMEKCSEMKYQMSTLYKYAEQKFDDDDDDDDGDDQEELNGNAQEWLSNGLFALHIRFPVICNESVTLSTVIKMEHFACVRDISHCQ